jgi:hypothetical protein
MRRNKKEFTTETQGTQKTTKEEITLFRLNFSLFLIKRV